MNGNYSLWRIFVPVDVVDSFHATLENIKRGDNRNRLQSIHPGDSIHRFDIILNEEELLVLRLAVPGIIYGWMKDWIYAKL